jgi:hypothetical protein
MPSGGGNTTTTTQASGPPAWLQPFLKQGADQDWNLYTTPGPGYFPGNTVANPSTATQAGNQAAVARGLNGNAAENAGTGYLANVLNGKYLGGQNLDPVHRSIAASVIPNVNAQFSLGGRYGSPDHAGSMTTALANAEAPYDYGNYQTERANQQSAAGMAPGYASQDWQDIAGLQGAGSQQDQIAQNQIDANKQRWDYNQNLGQNKLQQYMQLLMGPNWGNTTSGTTTTPDSSGGIPGMIGGLLGGLLHI